MKTQYMKDTIHVKYNDNFYLQALGLSWRKSNVWFSYDCKNPLIRTIF